jgi:hypothetical protein
MKKLKNKLVLDRETISVLQSDTLDGVNGGVVATGCILPPSRPGTSNISSFGLGCGGPISRQLSQVSQISQISQLSQVSRQISRDGGFSGFGR